MITVNTAEFEDALRFVIGATGKLGAPLLNKYALQAIIGSKGVLGAMQRTPKADRARIRALEDKQIRGLIVKRLRRAGKLSQTSTAQINSYVRFERQRRTRAAGYTAFIGWTNAAKAFGGTGARGAGKTALDEEQFSHSEAKKGFGRNVETAGNLLAEMVNTAPMAEEIGAVALQESLDAQAEDMMNYGTGKLQEVFTRAAGRYTL